MQYIKPSLQSLYNKRKGISISTQDEQLN